MHGGESGGVGGRQRKGEPCAGGREVRAQEIAEVVVGDAREQCRGDSERTETGGDVEARAARAWLERGRAGGGEVHQRVSGDDDGRLVCGFRSGARVSSSGTAAARSRAGGWAVRWSLVALRDRLTISLKRISRKMC
jgi:hypothetical protein